MTGSLRWDLWKEVWTQDKTLEEMGESVLAKKVPFYWGQGGNRYSSSLAKYVTPPSHQHPILCDPPSHGATRPAVLPGPGQWLQCPVYCPASCLTAGMPHPVLLWPHLLPQTTPASLTQGNILDEEGMTPTLRTFSSVKLTLTFLSEIFIKEHYADQFVYSVGNSGLHNTSQWRTLKGSCE